ncbi:TerD family protein [Yimella sp. cx-573]|nr:TerD family protein [Yimella sp. cx-573]
MTDLVAGQNAPWSGETARVRLRGAADLSALLLGADGRVRDEGDLVFYNAPGVDCLTWQAMDAQTQELNLVLPQVDPQITIVRCIASVDSDQPALTDGAISIEVNDMHTYRPTRLSGERALITVEFYRRGDAWKVRAVGQGWVEGLAAALVAHGIEVEQESAPPPSPFPVTTAPAPQQSPSGAPGWHDSSAPAMPGPDDDTVAGALRAMNSIRSDVSQACRAYTAALDYAESKMLAAQENSRTLGGQAEAALAQVEAEHNDIVMRASDRFDQECAGLREELVAEELSMPLPLARLDSFDWESVLAAPAGHTPGAPIDTHDERASLFRLGGLYPPANDSLRVPMPHRWAGRPLMWADGADRPPTAIAWTRGILARSMALTRPGALDVQVVDLDGSITARWGRLAPAVDADITMMRTPAELAGFIDAFVHQCELAKMAFESRIPEALDDVRDGARHLVVLGHFPHGYDQRSIQRLADALPWAVLLDVQVIVATDEQTVLSTLDGDENDPLVQMVRQSLWLQDGTEPQLVDGAGVPWCFDSELTTSAMRTIDRILSEGHRAR